MDGRWEPLLGSINTWRETPGTSYVRHFGKYELILLLLLLEAIDGSGSIEARTKYEIYRRWVKSGRDVSNIEMGNFQNRKQSTKDRLCRSWECTIIVLEHGDVKKVDSIGTLEFYTDGTWSLSDLAKSTAGEWTLSENANESYLIIKSRDRNPEFNRRLFLMETSWGIELHDTRHIPHFVDYRWHLVPAK